MMDYNRIVSFLLRSPLHALLDKWVMLLTCMGRKSGKSYTFPVQYVRTGSSLLVVSRLDRTWWRNLIESAPVNVHIGNQDAIGTAHVIDNPATGLTRIIENAPRLAPAFKIRLNPDGQPNPADLARAAKDHVVVQIQMD